MYQFMILHITNHSGKMMGQSITHLMMLFLVKRQLSFLPPVENGRYFTSWLRKHLACHVGCKKNSGTRMFTGNHMNFKAA
jgi:hypothetical protein